MKPKKEGSRKKGEVGREREREGERKGRERQDDVAMDPGLEKRNDHNNPLVDWKIRTRNKRRRGGGLDYGNKTIQENGETERAGEKESDENGESNGNENNPIIIIVVVIIII